jgi:hypothetical protein
MDRRDHRTVDAIRATDRRDHREVDAIRAYGSA